MLVPEYEKQLLANSRYRFIIGIDEVGRGCWAGPLVMGAYLFTIDDNQVISGVKDSKALNKKSREIIQSEINPKFISLEEIPANVISEIGLAKSIHLAIDNLVSKFNPEQSYFLLDGGLKLSKEYNFETIIKGDGKIYSIALAAIAAKVYRDNYMASISKQYPEYGFETHVGYGTLKHREALAKHGATLEHRMNYKPLMPYTSQYLGSVTTTK